MKYAYWLDNTGLSNGKKRLLLNYFQTAEEVYRGTETEYQKISELKEEEIRRLTDTKCNWNIEEEYEKLSESGVRVIFEHAKDYPEKLKNIYHPPFALYYIGKLPKERLTVAIVGARRCSEYGYYMARKLGEALGHSRIPVISGLAEGIDAAGQMGTLKGGGETYAVLGCGVDICYPKQNVKLYETIKKQGGIISELPPQTTPKPYHFPARNRIISGLADVIVIAEAKKKSGSLITAEHALEQGKDIYVFPGRTTDALSYGCNALIQQGAGIILSVEEFLKQLSENTAQNIEIGKNQKQCLAKEESLVYSCLSIQPKSLEKIAEETGIEISAVAGILLSLLAKGMVFESFRSYYIEE